MTDNLSEALPKYVLIVEDQFMLALEMKTAFEAKGWTVVGPCPTVREAMHYVETTYFNVACLDYRLENETSEDIALALHEKEIPFVFITGDNLALQKSAFRHSNRILYKPLIMDDLIRATENTLD